MLIFTFNPNHSDDDMQNTVISICTHIIKDIFIVYLSMNVLLGQKIIENQQKS